MSSRSRRFRPEQAARTTKAFSTRVDLRTAAIGLACALPLFALGAVTPPGLLAGVLAVGAASAVLALQARDTRATTLPTRVAGWALAAVALYTVAQLVPLPLSLLRLVSATAAQQWATHDSMFGQAPRAHPITLDPPATAFMAATSLAVALHFRTCAEYAASSRQRVRLVSITIAIVLLFVLVSLAHPLIGATKLYGFYEPRDLRLHDRVLLSPLLNRNHAAALASVAPPLLIGIGLEARTGSARLFAAVGAVFAATAVTLSLSRGGIAVMMLQLIALGGYALLRRREGGRRRVAGALAIVAVLLAATVAGLFVVMEPLRARFANEDYSKLRIARHAFEMAAHYPWTGVGRGAFGAVSPAYEGPMSAMMGGHADVRYSHVENWPGQLVVELGLPVAIAFASAIGFAILRSFRGASRRPVTVAAVVALVGLGVHDLFDFSLEFAGVALIAATLLAIVTTSAGPRTRGGEASHLAAPASQTRVLGFAAAVTCLAVTLVVRDWNHAADDEARSLSARWRSGTLSDVTAEIAAATRRHPTDPFFPMLAGVAVLNTPNAGPWLAHAVRLGPARAQTHFWLARWFVAVDRRAQAWAEYRMALRLAPALASLIIADALSFGAPLADIEAIAADASTLEFDALEIAARGLVERERGADAELLDAYIIEKFPPAVKARVRVANRARAQGDLPRARALAASLLDAAPTVADGYLLAASLEDDGVAAEAILDRGLARLGDDVDVLSALILRRGARVGTDSLQDEIDRLRRALATREGSTWKVQKLLGDVELARKRPVRALKYFLDAAAGSPDGLATLDSAAMLAESLELWSVAEESFRRLADAHPDDARYQAALGRVKAAAARPPKPRP